MNKLELSIQIRLGGFSFSIRQQQTEVSSGVVDGFDFSMIEPRRWGVDAYDRAVVWCDVPWATLVPVEVYRQESTANYLAALNLLAADRLPMAVQQGAAMVVWAIEQTVVEAFEAAVPATQIEWTHPLAWLLDGGSKDAISVWTTGDVAHTAIFDQQGLVAARSFVCSSPDDLLYTMVQMSRRCDPDQRFGVWLVGRVDAALETTLGSSYQRVSVTNDPLALVRSL